jgi:hypothetical protein
MWRYTIAVRRFTAPMAHAWRESTLMSSEFT